MRRLIVDEIDQSRGGTETQPPKVGLAGKFARQ